MQELHQWQPGSRNRPPGRSPTSDFAAAALLKDSIHGIGGLLDNGKPNQSFKSWRGGMESRLIRRNRVAGCGKLAPLMPGSPARPRPATRFAKPRLQSPGEALMKRSLSESRGWRSGSGTTPAALCEPCQAACLRRRRRVRPPAPNASRARLLPDSGTGETCHSE